MTNQIIRNDMPRRWVVTVTFKEDIAPIITEANGTPRSIAEYYFQDGGLLNVGDGENDRMAHIAEVTFK